MKLWITRPKKHVAHMLGARENFGDSRSRPVGQTQGQTQAALSVQFHQQGAIASSGQGKSKIEGHRGFTNAPFLTGHGDDVHASPDTRRRNRDLFVS